MTKTTKSPKSAKGFKLNDYIVYPTHGVGRITEIERQEIAGMKLQLFVIAFEQDKMTLRVPTSRWDQPACASCPILELSQMQ